MGFICEALGFLGVMASDGRGENDGLLDEIDGATKAKIFIKLIAIMTKKATKLSAKNPQGQK